jgi:hypothetical protein
MTIIQIDFDVEFFLSNMANVLELNKEDRIIIDRLCKKIDVVKMLFTRYSSNLSKKKSDEEVSPNSYQILFSLLQLENELDYKFLNTAFKINDILLLKNLQTEVQAADQSNQLLAKCALLDIKKGQA